MAIIAQTPQPPYYAVIFTAIASQMQDGYAEMVARMHELAQESVGYLGMESAGSSFEITVSYWKDEESIRNWKNNSAHKVAQELGKSNWYNAFHVRVARVERAYGFIKD